MISVQKTILLLAVVALCPLTASAYDIDRATLNLSADLSECAGYYAIVSETASDKPDIATAYKESSINMLQMAIDLSNEKAASARTQTAIKEMFKELGGDLGNMSILINKYSDLCQEIADDIESRLQYWLDKKD